MDPILIKLEEVKYKATEDVTPASKAESKWIERLTKYGCPLLNYVVGRGPAVEVYEVV